MCATTCERTAACAGHTISGVQNTCASREERTAACAGQTISGVQNTCASRWEDHAILRLPGMQLSLHTAHTSTRTAVHIEPLTLVFLGFQLGQMKKAQVFSPHPSAPAPPCLPSQHCHFPFPQLPLTPAVSPLQYRWFYQPHGQRAANMVRVPVQTAGAPWLGVAGVAGVEWHTIPSARTYEWSTGFCALVWLLEGHTSHPGVPRARCTRCLGTS